MRYIKYFAILLFLIFWGCAPKSEVTKSSSMLVTFKTKKLSFRDTGFLKKGGDFLNLEVFAVGKPIAKIFIQKGSDRVCLNSYCFNKRIFNEEYLSSYYPDSLLENVLRGNKIFNGKNLKKDKNGFLQRLKERGKFDIKYRVKNGEIFFKDKLNRIIISLKPLKM